jgi:hypothetical protein
MNIVLNSGERIQLAGILPVEGNMVDQILVKSIREKIKITEEEVKDFNLQATEKGGVTLKVEGTEKDFDFSFKEFELMKREIENLDKAEKINQENVDLCSKIKNFQEEGE